MSVLFFRRPLSPWSLRHRQDPLPQFLLRALVLYSYIGQKETQRPHQGSWRLGRRSCHRMHAFPCRECPCGAGVSPPHGLCEPWPLLRCGGRGGWSRRPRAPSPFLPDVSAGGAGFLAVIQPSSRQSLCMEGSHPLGLCGHLPSVRSLGPPTPSSGRCQVTPEHPPAGAFFKP